jgi:hypothetical protein
MQHDQCYRTDLYYHRFCNNVISYYDICVLVISQNTMHIFISPYPYVAQQPTNAFAQAKLVDGKNFVAAENAIEFHMITCF